MKYFKKILSIFIMVIILLGMIAPYLQPSFAAANDVFNPSFTYNEDTGKWDITWTPIDGATHFTVVYHEPDKDNPDGFKTITEGSISIPENEINKISLSFAPDHIYDLTFSFKNNSGETVEFRNKYNELVEEETVFFLSDITFEGTSFNDMGGILDDNPKTNNDTENGEEDEPITRVISGHEPQITLKWKVPTIYDVKNNSIVWITDISTKVCDRLKPDNTTQIDYSYFHIRMDEVTDRVTPKDYRTKYNNSNKVIIKETGTEVLGFDENGKLPDDSDGFVSCILDYQNHGIKPGTEYANVDIRLFFWDKDKDEQAIFTKLVYGYDSGNGFSIRNRDIIFQNIEGGIDSIFTPMHFEVSKVDIDKMEVKVKKIKNRNYPNLYYQVQEAGAISDFLEGNSSISGGIKMPDSSIPEDIGWGSIIIEIPLNENGEHPERYYRVVVTDGDSNTPLGSLAIDLSMLGNDTGKPPVPREIHVQPIYEGKQHITVDGTKVEIPVTNTRISFEKPLYWDSIPESDSEDLTFHILLNTYLSDDVKESETKLIGDPKVEVNLPVTERRVVSFGRESIHVDESTGRLYFDLDGTNLFHDFHSGNSLEHENDADYPNFLVPNTRYYLRMFSTWADDHSNIDWVKGDMEELSKKISYISPIVSFTTYPSRDIPIALPNISLEVNLKDEPDPETGRPVFNGIAVSFSKILDNDDWEYYTDILEGRRIEYELFISDSNDEGSFLSVEKIDTFYPDDMPDVDLSTLVTQYPRDDGEQLKPNTTYYFKMQAKLYVNDEEEPFLTSDETPVKSITTPKTDSGSMDDLERLPRTPVEFSIATDSNGELQLSDAKVTLTWLHAEQDVTYEMVCTTQMLDADASLDDYIDDENHIGDRRNPGFLMVYEDYKTNSNDTELNIDVLTTPLRDLGFSYNEDNNRVVLFPINLPFLKPNRLYYFNLRAVRNRGADDATYSSWVSIPITTKMVMPPKFLEAVTDVQLGFNIRLSGNVPAEDLKVLLKKADHPDSAYMELPRAKYSVVKDGRRYYFRLYDLEPDTWYDIQPFYNDGDDIIWYENDDEDWSRRNGDPVQMKTRNTLNEIEIRFEGESLYDYFIEVRTDDDENYINIEYDRDKEDSDYGYTLKDGTRIEFYREKTVPYVEGERNNTYMYYAKIYQTRRKRSDGTYKRLPLLSNTRYYIKVWARNEADSSHIGPVTVRTDFSQKDYDDDYMRDEISDMFESKADGLTRKLYFTVDEIDKTANRVLLKGAMISNLMKVTNHTGITVDISKEKPDVEKDIIIIPMEILENLQRESSRLTIKMSGGELILTGDTVNLDSLKRSVGVAGVKETMLELTVQRKTQGSVQPSYGFSYGSKVFDVNFDQLSMRRTYAQMNEIIYDILKEPNASGPFKYGILDRELKELLEKETTLTYKSQVELENLIDLIIDKVEEELSLYIKDIIDGGRGFSPSVINRAELPELQGGVKLKILQNSSSHFEPYVLPYGQHTWSESIGIKGWVFPYVLLTAKVPGEYTVFNLPQIRLPDTDGFIDPNLNRLSQKYNLRKIFGNTLYPGDYVSGDNAVNLYEVITETETEVQGLSTPAKINYYSLNDILPVSQVHQEINKGQAYSIVVEMYAFKTGVPSQKMSPSAYMYIKNADKIPDAIYNRLMVALDLGITSLEADYTYNCDKKATVEEVLNAVITVLDLLGEW